MIGRKVQYVIHLFFIHPLFSIQAYFDVVRCELSWISNNCLFVFVPTQHTPSSVQLIFDLIIFSLSIGSLLQLKQNVVFVETK